MSNDTADAGFDKPRFEIYSIMAMLSFFSFVGIVGNTVVIYVYTRGKIGQQQTATVFIVSLAVGDLIASSLTMPFTMAYEFLDFGFTDSITCHVYGLLLTSTIPFSSLVMVGIAFDRYLCICHPFKRLMNVRRAVGMVVLFTVIAGTYGTLGAFLYTVVPDVACAGNVAVDIKSVNNATTPPWDYYNTSTDYDYSYYHTDGNTSASAALGSATSAGVSIASLPVTMVTDAKPAPLVPDCRMVCENDGNDLIFQIYQNFNYGLFLLVVIIVSILYTLIYKSVAKQRRKKSRMLGRSARTTVLTIDDDTQVLPGAQDSPSGGSSEKTETNGNTKNNGNGNTISDSGKRNSKNGNSDHNENSVSHNDNNNNKNKNNNNGNSHSHCHSSDSNRKKSGGRAISVTSKCSNASAHKKPMLINSNGKKLTMTSSDENHRSRQNDERMRNLKMALMLFIVTIVFVISFTPSIILLIVSIVVEGAETPGVLFNLYFMMNAANPVIYCFMNPNFRLTLNALFKRRR